MRTDQRRYREKNSKTTPSRHTGAKESLQHIENKLTSNDRKYFDLETFRKTLFNCIRSFDPAQLGYFDSLRQRRHPQLSLLSSLAIDQLGNIAGRSEQDQTAVYISNYAGASLSYSPLQPRCGHKAEAPSELTNPPAPGHMTSPRGRRRRRYFRFYLSLQSPVK